MAAFLGLVMHRLDVGIVGYFRSAEAVYVRFETLHDIDEPSDLAAVPESLKTTGPFLSVVIPALNESDCIQLVHRPAIAIQYSAPRNRHNGNCSWRWGIPRPR